MTETFTQPRHEQPRLGRALELMQRLWTLNHELERMSARMSRELGITAQQRMVLRIVGRFPGITPGRLSELLCVDAATVSTTIARLEKRGLLRRHRDSHDLRRVSVALTADGRALDVPTTGTVEAAVEAALAQSSALDVDAAARVLESLTHALTERLTPAATASPSAEPTSARHDGAHRRSAPRRR
jgi:DNA-binding MarR family transcriptional regulator